MQLIFLKIIVKKSNTFGGIKNWTIEKSLTVLAVAILAGLLCWRVIGFEFVSTLGLVGRIVLVQGLGHFIANNVDELKSMIVHDLNRGNRPFQTQL